MKVLILSTYETTGGAAIAASRLLHALRKNGVDSTGSPTVDVSMLCRKNLSWWKGKPQSWSSILERGRIFIGNGLSRKNLWSTDTGLYGQDITKTKEYREADVIHLHWVNQGFISLFAINQFLKDGKKVVWTMHDEWPLDSVYHYTNVDVDDDANANALAREVFVLKRQLYASGKITFVTCSEWLKGISEKKPLAEGQTIVSIPNAIDTTVFKPTAVPSSKFLRSSGCSGEQARSQVPSSKRVLFVSQNVNDERKGIKYLDEAADILNADADKVEIVALGRDIPYISDVEEMAALYAGFDAFVTPSLQDNLPNTIMEAMACGTPCVGFNVGGIPEMIDHKENGYVARYKDAKDLAEGIRYVLSKENHERLSKAAREKVLRCYSEESVAKRYLEVYKGLRV